MTTPAPVTRPTHAMVLAAGLGVRMRPLTEHRPKPLVEVAGRTLIDRLLDRLVLAGVTTAVVNAHYLADRLEEHLKSRAAPRIEISDERRRLLGTGGGVKVALPRLGAQPFYICNSDSLWIEGVGANLDRLARAFDETALDAVLLLAPVVEAIGYDGRGDFALTPDGLLRRRREREIVPYAFAGVSIASPRLFDATPDGPFSLNLPWDRAIAAGRIRGVRLEGRWMHVGTPEALTEAAAALSGLDAGREL